MKQQVKLSQEMSPIQRDMVLRASSVNILVNSLTRIHKSKKHGILNESQIKTIDQSLHTKEIEQQASDAYTKLRSEILRHPNETTILLCALIDRIETKAHD